MRLCTACPGTFFALDLTPDLASDLRPLYAHVAAHLQLVLPAREDQSAEALSPARKTVTSSSLTHLVARTHMSISERQECIAMVITNKYILSSPDMKVSLRHIRTNAGDEVQFEHAGADSCTCAVCSSLICIRKAHAPSTTVVAFRSH